MKKQLIIIGIIIILLTVGLSGCNTEKYKFVGTWTERNLPSHKYIFRIDGTVESIYADGTFNGTWTIINSTHMRINLSWYPENDYYNIIGYKFITNDILILTYRSNIGGYDDYIYDRT